MPEKIYVGNFGKGLVLDRLPFVIDNDSFPTLVNAYSWRGRIKRKRGTDLLGRLQLQVAISGTTTSGGGITLADTPIAPGTVSITIGGNTYTDSSDNGVLYLLTVASGTVNYLTGAVVITGASSVGYTGSYSYYPELPVMGLEDFISGNNPYPLTIAFDTVNAYQVNQSGSFPYFYNVSYYYGTGVPVTWSGADYEQFWSCNYEGAFWATNGKAGFNFLSGTYSSDSGTTTVTFNFKNGASNFTKLVVGDVLFFNEWGSSTALNTVSGTVSNISGAASGNYVVTFTNAPTVSSTGIAFMLTNQLGGQDGIRWYNGDPTGGTGLGPTGNLGWVNFNPPLSNGNFGFDNLTPAPYYLVGATAVIPFKDRLLFFGPQIQATNQTAPTYLQDTVIWSWNGTPYYSPPTPLTPSGQTQYGYDPTAYYVNVTGKGGYISAGTAQEVVTVSYNEDVVLVGFTGKQTRFVYTGNDLLPFLFYIINSEFGSSATFSGITLDKGALTIGSYGLFLTAQVQSQRIDLQIPDNIFNISNRNEGSQRVNSARDFFREWVYFSYPFYSSPWVYPTQTLLYNYRDDTWAVLYENYTTHGSFRLTTGGLTWANSGQYYSSWANWNDPWDASVTSYEEPSVIAGNQQGFVMQLDVGTSEGNSGYITSITQVNILQYTINSHNHCLSNGDYVQLNNLNGITGLNGLIGQVTINPSDTDNFTLTYLMSQNPTFSGTYIGGGLFTRYSQPFVQTKQFPTYWEGARQVIIGNQKYLFDKTSLGQVTVNLYLSTDYETSWNNGPIVPSDQATNSSLIYSQLLYTCPENYIQPCNNVPMGNIGNGSSTSITINLATLFSISGNLVPGSATVTVGALATFTDNGNGTMTGTGTGSVSGTTINYATGIIILSFTTAPASTASTITFQYYYGNIQDPTSNSQQQIWHRMNTSLLGSTVQIGFTLSDAQMRNETIATSEIALQAMVIDVTPGPLVS
jgi:hypothetical protein